jgi:Holliday junction DNA helicase RuvA
MIAHVSGTLVARDLDRIEIMTAGGTAYELQIPLSVYETLPRAGDAISLHTHLVVKDDGWQLFGFASDFERRLFRKLLDAKGVGPALALGLMSALSADRLVRAIREKDIATLQSVPRVGRKKAEQLILDLADKLDALLPQTSAVPKHSLGPAADDALRALVALGYTASDADRALRAALDGNGNQMPATELIRASLAKLSTR